MKKLLFIISLSMMLSCSEDFTQKDGRNTVTVDQIADLANSSPEAAFTVVSGFESGNYTFLNQFDSSGNGNNHDDFGYMAINFGLDNMSNDNVQVINHWFGRWYNYTNRVENSIRTDMVWKFYYKVIYQMNTIIEFLPGTPADPALRALKGRALAMRGFAYFNLIRIYANGEQGIPLVLDSSKDLSRVATSTIKAQILSDYNVANSYLTGYVRSTKTQLDENVVQGFLARYHLEYGNYALAASFANQARTNYAPMTNINDGFNKIDNTEWMWGADIDTNTSTYYASFFSHVGNLNPGYAGLLNVYKNIDRRLYEKISPTDSRLSWFDGPANGLPMYANTKFIDDTDFEGDYVFMRGSEMYLIEAEALAASGDETGAKQVLFDLISTRDAAYVLSANTGTALRDEIRAHRGIELWGEGFAWFDMKRWGVGLQRTYTGTNHPTFGRLDYPAGDNKFRFQIPLSELNANPIPQNPF